MERAAPGAESIRSTSPITIAEWGVPEYDPRALWEKLVLDGFQAGLAWITILRKREAFRDAFAGFEPAKSRASTRPKIAALLANPGIVRSRAKIEATISGARNLSGDGEERRGFRGLLLELRRRPADRPPAEGLQSRARAIGRKRKAMAKDLKARGFKFCGPVIVYAFMQAVGMINDHHLGLPGPCPRRGWRHRSCAALGDCSHAAIAPPCGGDADDPADLRPAIPLTIPCRSAGMATRRRQGPARLGRGTVRLRGELSTRAPIPAA